MQAKVEPTETSGQVKWFDPAKGFGFVLDAGGGADILLHANVLLHYGQSSVAAGTRIRLLTLPTERGAQAVEVLDIQPQPDGPPAPILDLLACNADELSRLPFQPARVKWFSKSKGFGFLNLFGQPGDVFLHLEVLRHSGLTDLAVGEAVAARVIEGRRGPMAAQLAAWDQPGLGATRSATGEPSGSDDTLRQAPQPPTAAPHLTALPRPPAPAAPPDRPTPDTPHARSAPAPRRALAAACGSAPRS